MGSSSNRYAPRLPQQETKSSTKLLALTDPILAPENFLKTGFAETKSHKTACSTDPILGPENLLKTLFCSNVSMASARSLYKFLLVVLIHAREAGTEVKASCANMMSRVGPLMVQTNTTNQNPNNTNQQKPNTTQNKSKPQKKQKHQRKEAISGMLKTSSSHRSEKWCKDGSLCAINPTNKKKNLLKTGSAPKGLPSKSWASLVPRSNSGFCIASVFLA